MIIGLAGIGIAGGLRLLDLVAERHRPFFPGEQAALVELQRQRKGFGFPRLTKYGTILVTRNVQIVIPAERAERGCFTIHAGSRYGSKASIETLSVGSAFSPHNSRPSNSTV